MVTAGRIRAIDSADNGHIKQEVRWERRLVSLSSMHTGRVFVSAVGGVASPSGLLEASE